MAAEKTEILFATSRNKREQIARQVCGHGIIFSSGIKYLDIMVDVRTTFAIHIDIVRESKTAVWVCVLLQCGYMVP